MTTTTPIWKINRISDVDLPPLSLSLSLKTNKNKCCATPLSMCKVAHVEPRRTVPILWDGPPAASTAHAALSQLDHEGQRRVGRRSQAAQQTRQSRRRRYLPSTIDDQSTCCLSLSISHSLSHWHLFLHIHLHTHTHATLPTRPTTTIYYEMGRKIFFFLWPAQYLSLFLPPTTNKKMATT